MKKPSVTELVDMLAKPALIEWANRKGLMGIDIKALRKQRKLAGTSMHSQIEQGAFDREIDSMQYAKFMRGKTLIDSEVKIETDWFTGRYDARIQVGDQQYIVDYKSGYKNRLYLEQKLQLIAYTMAVPAKMAIIPVPSFDFVEVVIQNRKPYEEFLKALSSLWYIKKEIEA